MTVFVEENFGAETSVLKGIRIYGHPVEDIGTKKLQKSADVADYWTNTWIDSFFLQII